MNEVIPDLEHPLVEIASRMMRPDGQGSWIFEREDAMILEAAILQEKHDPRIPAALLGLFRLRTSSTASTKPPQRQERCSRC